MPPEGLDLAHARRPQQRTRRNKSGVGGANKYHSQNRSISKFTSYVFTVFCMIICCDILSKRITYSLKGTNHRRNKHQVRMKKGTGESILAEALHAKRPFRGNIEQSEHAFRTASMFLPPVSH